MKTIFLYVSTCAKIIKGVFHVSKHSSLYTMFKVYQNDLSYVTLFIFVLPLPKTTFYISKG